MTGDKSTKKEAIRARRRRRGQLRQLTPFLYIALGLLLIVGASFLISDQNVAAAPIDYSPEDVVNDRPLLAVHEMAPLSLSSIPFLPKDGPQPKIAISETFFNFGTIGLQDVVQHEFVIANVGDAPLTISRAYTTCGCTTAKFTSTVIPPGKVAVMTLILDAGFHDVGGQTVRRGVIIENNDPRNPEVEIWTQASVLTTP